MKLDLETILTSPRAFGLTTASPLQRAICRMLDGRPLGELAELPEVCAAFGGADAVRALPANGVGPRRATIIAAIRTGKTLLAAATAVRSTQTIRVDHLRVSDELRTPILAPTKDLAHVAYSHIRGSIEASPILRRLMTEEPTAESMFLRHTTGRSIEIKVSAASAGGGSILSRWLGDGLIDEVCFWPGADDGKVLSLEDVRTAGMARLLGQWLEIGSPWIAAGPVYKDFVQHFGRPTSDLVVVKADARTMNPSYWTQARCEAVREADSRAYETNICANFVDDTAAAFDGESIEAMLRPLPPELIPAGAPIVVTDASGGKGDAWTWCSAQWFAARRTRERYLTVHAYDAAGNIIHRDAAIQRDEKGEPIPNPEWSDLRPVLLVRDVGAMVGKFAGEGSSVVGRICDQIARVARIRGARIVMGDQYAALSTAEHFRQRGLTYLERAWGAQNKAAAVMRARALMRDAQIIIEAGPYADRIRHELARYRERIRQTGGSSFAGSGAHDDFVSACVLGPAHADNEGHLTGSPARVRNVRTDYGGADFTFG